MLQPLIQRIENRAFRRLGLEDSHEPYVGILVRWYSQLLTHPIHHIEIVADAVGAMRSAVDTWFWNSLEGMDSPPLTLRKRTHTISDLTDATMTKWLLTITLVQLSALATRWDSGGRANNKPGVLEELGLTVRSMLDIPNAEFVRLKL